MMEALIGAIRHSVKLRGGMLRLEKREIELSIVELDLFGFSYLRCRVRTCSFFCRSSRIGRLRSAAADCDSRADDDCRQGLARHLRTGWPHDRAIRQSCRRQTEPRAQLSHVPTEKDACHSFCQMKDGWRD